MDVHCTDISGFVFPSLLKKWQLSRPVADKKKKRAFVDSRWISRPAFHLFDVDPNHKQVRWRLYVCLQVSVTRTVSLPLSDMWVKKLEVKISQSDLQRKLLNITVRAFLFLLFCIPGEDGRRANCKQPLEAPT